MNVFSKGNVLFGKLRPYLAKCVVADTDGVCSSEFLVLAPSDEVAPAYLNATMLMQEFIDVVDASTFGAKMPRADWGFIGQQRLPLPPPDEQDAIADYLDVEIARIDMLIHEKDGLIGLLKELRQSVIMEAVTKGLNKTALLKPSGVPWLDKVPEHWDILPLRRLVKTVKTGTTPSDVDEHHFDDEGIAWFRPGDFSEQIFLESAEKMLSEEGVAGVRIFPEFTVMHVGIGATLGKVGITTQPSSCNQQINAIICNERLYHVYAAYFLKTIKDYIFKCGKYTTLPIINQDETKALLFAVPPTDEQKAIADHLDAETAKIDDLIAHTNDEITLLKELRAATIADAVLGRVDVRTAPKQ